MNDSNADKTASLVLKYLLHLLSIAAVYFVLLYTVSTFWFRYLLIWFSKINYLTPIDFHNHVIYQLIIYCAFCYFANNFLLNLYEKGKTKQLIFSIIADLLVVPLSILIMIIYNNIFHIKHSNVINTIYNIYLVTVLLVIKEYITMKLLAPKGAAQR